MHEAVRARLQVDDQLYTSSRRTIVEVLAGAERPLTIPELLELRRLPQSSVYRNLAVLERAKVVHRLPGVDDFARYELTEDLTDNHHHHLICTSCGTVTDFTVARALEETLAKAMKKVATETGFQADAHQLDFVGLCVACAPKAARRTRR